ncbi:hypothetical protein AV654_27195 [Paenibacillus elgii]|uniref:Uncharacterized protein n=1 Tax=Paenibacillus elgii TaxID=189691 RepID=A0A165QHQ6_9BACL|nr:hypothetical protein [Paenibacillus elgii]KZE75042.1 hypothetical protein AV654_27195 [Paenibacillus elgii]
MKKKIVSAVVGTAMVCSFAGSAFANAAQGNAPVSTSVPLGGKITPTDGNYYVTLDQKTKEFLNTFTKSGVAKELSEQDGRIIMLHDDINYLKSTYGLTDEYISLLNRLVDQANQKMSKASMSGTFLEMAPRNSVSSVTPNLHVSDWKIYFNQDDIQQYLFVAAGVGVPAFIIALEGISLILGPAGPIITTILTIAGYSGMANLCYLVLQSKYNNQKGVYFGISWNGVFPNLTQGTW